MLLGNYLTIRLQQNSSGVATKVVAETTSVDMQCNAEAMESTNQGDALVSRFVAGKNTIQVSGDYLLASDAEQFELLFAHKNAGDKIEVDIYRSDTLVMSTEGVFSSLNASGALSDSLATGAYSMELDTTVLDAYESQYQTVYDSFTTKPSGAIAEAQNTMVASLVSGGVWAELDVFYVFAQTTNGGSEALKNWMSPGTNNATLVSTPTFTALEGFTGNASSWAINTGFNASTEGVNYVQDDCSYFVYVRDNQQDDLFVCGARDATAISSLAPRHSSDKMYFDINQSGAVNDTNANSSGLSIVQRTASNAIAAYRNGATIITDTTASNNIPNNNFHVLSRTDAAGDPNDFTDFQVSVFGAGGSLTSEQRSLLESAIETYMDSNSKGVIS